MKSLLCGVGAVTLFATVSLAGDTAPEFTLTDLEGSEHQLSEYEGKLVVLEWMQYGCPFVRKQYETGKLPALQKKYTAEGVVWLCIASGKSADEDELKNHRFAKKNAATAVLLDKDGHVGKAYGAKATPQFFVLNDEGQIVYEGALDDDRSPDPTDLSASTNYVADALDALMEGKPVEVTISKPFGCGIRYGD